MIHHQFVKTFYILILTLVVNFVASVGQIAILGGGGDDNDDDTFRTKILIFGCLNLLIFSFKICYFYV